MRAPVCCVGFRTLDLVSGSTSHMALEAIVSFASVFVGLRL